MDNAVMLFALERAERKIQAAKKKAVSLENLGRLSLPQVTISLVAAGITIDTLLTTTVENAKEGMLNEIQQHSRAAEKALFDSGVMFYY